MVSSTVSVQVSKLLNDEFQLVSWFYSRTYIHIIKSEHICSFKGAKNAHGKEFANKGLAREMYKLHVTRATSDSEKSSNSELSKLCPEL